MFCPHCGNQFVQEAAFCGHCGQPREVAYANSGTETDAAATSMAPPPPSSIPPAPAPGPNGVPLSWTPAEPNAALAGARAAGDQLSSDLRLDTATLVTSLKQSAAVLGIAVAALTVLAFVVKVATHVSGIGIADLIRSAVYVIGMAFGGSATVTGDLSSFASVTGALTVWVMPSGVTLLLCVALGFLGAAQERDRQSSTMLELLGGAMTSAAAFTVELVVVAFLARGSATFGGSASSVTLHFALGTLTLGFGTLVLSAAASGLGRLLARRHVPAIAATRTKLTSRRFVAPGDIQTSVLYVTVCSALALVVLTTIIVISSRHDPIKELLSGLGVEFLLLPSVAIGMAAIAMGSTWVADGQGTAGGFAGGHSHTTYGLFGAQNSATHWALLVPVVAVILVGLIAGARRPVTTGRWTSVWKTGAIVAVIYVLAAETLCRLSAHIAGQATGFDSSASANGIGVLHFGVVSILLAGFAWGAAARAVGVLLVVPLARRAPRATATLGRIGAWLSPDRTLDPDWAAQLANVATQLRSRSGEPAPAPVKPNASTGELPTDTQALLPDSAGFVLVPADPGADGTTVTLTPKKGFGKVLASLGLLAVLLIAGFIAVDKVVIPQMYGPGKTVVDYFGALSRGDAKSAMSYALNQGDKGPLLTSDALRSELAANPIRNVVIASTTTTGNRAFVHVTYTAGGQRENGTFDLAADQHDKRYGLFPRWKLTALGGDVSVSLSGYDTGVSADGVTVATGDYEVWPGVHNVEAASAPMVDGDSTVVSIPDNRTSHEADVATSISSAAQSSIDSSAQDAIDTCAGSDLSSPDGTCTLPSPSDAMGSVSWSWSTPPTVTVTDDGSNDLSSIPVQISGAITADYTDYMGDPQSDEEAVDMTGTLDLTGGFPSITLN